MTAQAVGVACGVGRDELAVRMMCAWALRLTKTALRRSLRRPRRNATAMPVVDRLMKYRGPFWYDYEHHISHQADDAADRGRADEGHQRTSNGESRAGP